MYVVRREGNVFSMSVHGGGGTPGPAWRWWGYPLGLSLVLSGGYPRQNQEAPILSGSTPRTYYAAAGTFYGHAGGLSCSFVDQVLVYSVKLTDFREY